MCYPPQSTYIQFPDIDTRPTMVAGIQSPSAGASSLYMQAPHSSSTLNQSEPRHVQFQESVTVIPQLFSSNDIDSGEDTNNTWYQLNELDSFRNDARKLCREMRYHDTLMTYADSGTSSSDSDSSTQSAQSSRLPSLARNSSTRGLEQRSCDERQRRKYLATRFILKIAPRLYLADPEKLAEVSRKCNAWATELAIEEAARDFERVYATGDNKRTMSESFRNGSKRVRIQ